MAPPDRRITILNPGMMVPPPDFFWPGGGPRPQYSEREIQATRRWVEETKAGRDILLRYRNSPANRDHYLSWVTYHVASEQQRFTFFSTANRNKVFAPLRLGSWERQRNALGMNTCVIASTINALRLIGLYDPTMHTEEAFIGVLDQRVQRNFAGFYRMGMSIQHLAVALSHLAPRVMIRGSNSLTEMLTAAQNGGAVLFAPTPAHEALIPPGHQLRRGMGEDFDVQYADPASAYPSFIPVEQLIRSQISVVPSGDFTNAFMILENTLLRNQFVRPPVVTIQRPPITTIKE